ncbi:MAG: ABC transporter permease [Chloroflexi bacterium]|nr:MAG: ABC transporter permease [Chloroflexota bacterium]
MERNTPLTIIEPAKRGFHLNLREIWQYRELLFFFVWREIKVRYKQTVFGVLWAILQPFMTMVVFTIFFGGLAQIDTNGIPYPVFSYAALVPWTFFSNSITGIAISMTSNANTIKKIYFPRIILPISQVGTYFVDFLMAFAVLLVMIVIYALGGPTQAADGTTTVQIQLSWNIIWLPFFLLLTMTTALGFGLWLAALNVLFRDVRYAAGFIIRLWMFITPVIYPTELLDETWQIIYSFNPMVGVIDGFRWALLGVGEPPTVRIVISVCVALVILVSGVIFFNRMERLFADVV